MRIAGRLKTGWVLWAWKHTPHCAEMSRLASRSLDQPLPLAIEFKMRLHYLICVWCKRYLNHLRFLRHAASHYAEQAGVPANRALTVEAKRRMLDRLQAG